MRYQRREDGLIAVTIDSNVWNLFYELGLDLVTELPPDRFRLFIPREVEIELAAIPGRQDKLSLKDYIHAQMAKGDVQTTAIAGFACHEGPQRYGGFGFGTFASDTWREFYDLVREPYLLGKGATNSQLTRNEADAALGATSFSSVVLTCDLKPGPLRVALENGGKVLDMRHFRESGKALPDIVTVCYEASR
jgi:hypothetical protein